MKNKRILAIALCIGLILSSLNGIFISYANNDAKNKVSNNELSMVQAPAQNIIELEPDLSEISIISDKDDVNSKNEGFIIYEGSKLILDPDNSRDAFNINKEDVENLVKKGFTVQEIFEADDIANEIYEDPIKLLERSKSSDKPMKEVKSEILKERKDNTIKELTTKYGNEYKKLQNEKFAEDEIITFFEYIESNNLKFTNELMKEYKTKGQEFFRENKKSNLTDATKKQYSLSDKEAEGLTEDVIATLNSISKKENKSLKELIKDYQTCLKNK